MPQPNRPRQAAAHQIGGAVPEEERPGCPTQVVWVVGQGGARRHYSLAQEQLVIILVCPLPLWRDMDFATTVVMGTDKTLRCGLEVSGTSPEQERIMVTP